MNQRLLAETEIAFAELREQRAHEQLKAWELGGDRAVLYGFSTARPKPHYVLLVEPERSRKFRGNSRGDAIAQAAQALTSES